MQKSPIIYWSGNNSQIYRTLAELEDEGFISAKIQYNKASPPKKIYSLTDSGRYELHRLSLEFPEIPEIRKTFLMQLVFGGNLSKSELELLLEQYGNEVKGAALTINDGISSDKNTPYESAILELAMESIRQSYELELAWIEKVRSVALPLAADAQDIQEKRRDTNMEYIKIRKNGKDYIKIISGQIMEEQDGLALVSACAESDTNKVLLPSDCLSGEFLRLSSRVAGLVLQKLTNYNIKTAVVIDTKTIQGKFRDFLIEANRGKMFHAFDDFKQAEKWLLGEDNR